MNSSIEIKLAEKLTPNELQELCQAAEDTISNSNGFNVGLHQNHPDHETLEKYFKGVLLVPNRNLFIAKYDNVVAGSLQISKPSTNNQTSDFAADLDNHFVAPWARGQKIASALLEAAENFCRDCKLIVLKISVKATRNFAISLYESRGYIKWGYLPLYEKDHDNQIVAGNFYYKKL